jgi:hypothetical protein
LYQEVLGIVSKQASTFRKARLDSHIGLPVKGLITFHSGVRHAWGSKDWRYLFGVKVLGTISVLLEKLAGSMTKQLVVGNLELKSATVPCIIQLNIIRMDESQLLV